MTIDILTIVLCGCLLILAIVTPLCNGLFRRPASKKRTDGSETDAAIKFSVVITAHNKGAELARNLPSFLSQNYKDGYEVIVVDESSTDDTDDVLTRLKNEYPHLYTTFIPDSSHYLSRRKLALTIGIKAAKNEWVILTDADCRPESDNWLKAMAERCKGADLVLGYTNYQPEASQFYRFERLLTSCYQMRKAQKGTAYRYAGSNLAMQKDIFMNSNGFIKNLKYLRGEYDFIVNEYATAGRTAIATSPDSFIRQESPYAKTWANGHLYYMETRKHLKRSFTYRALFNTDTLLLHANYIFELAVIAISILSGNMILTASGIAALFITITMRTVIAKKAANAFGERLSAWLIPLMEVRVAWQNLWFIIRHRFSDKYNFIRR